MDYNLSSIDHMGETLSKLYEKYGKSISHIYLLKTIIFKARYDEGKVFIDDEYIMSKLVEYQEIMLDKDKSKKMFEEMEFKVLKNPNDPTINSFIDFMLMARADEEIQSINKFHKKHKKSDNKYFF